MATDMAVGDIPTGSYARIRDPRVLLMIRVGLFAIFVWITVCGLLSLPASYRESRDEIISQPDTIHVLSSLGMSVDGGTSYSLIVTLVQQVGFTVAGFLIFFYRSDNWVAVLVSCGLVGNGIAGEIYIQPNLPFYGVLVVVQASIGFLPIFPMLCLFPDGRFVPRWSRLLQPAFVIATLPVIFINSLSVDLGMKIDTATFTEAALMSVFFWALGTGFLLLRLRRTNDGVQRQQIKMVFAGMLAVLITYSFTLLSLVPVIGTNTLFIIIVLPLVAALGIGFFAVAITCAMLRYRLWDIDLVLNRSIVYISVFVVLVLIFIGVVLILQSGLEAVLGPGQSTTAAVLSVGAVAALFNPTRLRLQPLVDRWLFGLRFDLNKVRADERPRSYPKPITDLKPEDYEIQELIGRGGMGEVYLGVQSTLKRQVAVKVLLPHLSANPEFRTRFERESRIVASLHHPNIITIFDFGDVSGMYYLVMEYIQGPDLAAFLRGQALSLIEAAPLITQIAAALDYAHTQGVVHRDVKPSNIMLKQQSNAGAALHPVLMDFGLTKLADSHSALTQSGPLGTLAYMAPEQITAAREADHRADIYALGVMCYQILTGKLPFSANNQAALLFAHLHKPPPDPRLTQPDFPAHAASALMRSLDKEPGNRQQSAGAFAAELFAAS